MAESAPGMTTESAPPALDDDGAARHLVNGLELPDLALPSSRGEMVNLSTRKGAAVVYVYPWTGRPGVADPPGWDDIPGAHGSTPETEGFRDHYCGFAPSASRCSGSAASRPSTSRAHRAPRRAVSAAERCEFAFKEALGAADLRAGGTPYLKRLTLFVRDGRIAHAFYPVERPATPRARGARVARRKAPRDREA